MVVRSHRLFGGLSMVVVRNTLWGIGTLFAVSLALLVSGATVIVMVCLLMLADLTDNFRGDALGEALLRQAGIGQTNKSEFGPGSTANLWLRLPASSFSSYQRGPQQSGAPH